MVIRATADAGASTVHLVLLELDLAGRLAPPSGRLCFTTAVLD